MKSPEASERHDEATPASPTKQPGEIGIRLVSRPDQKVLREWEITLPDELVARLTLNI
jgi:hypothetical protein